MIYNGNITLSDLFLWGESKGTVFYVLSFAPLKDKPRIEMIDCILHPRFCRLFLVVCLVQANAFCQKANPAIFSGERAVQSLSSSLSVLEDTSGTYSPQQVLSHSGFRANTKGIPNFNVSNSAFWVKFQILNQSQTEHLLLKLAQPNIESVVFYRLQADGKLEAEKSGILYPYRHRKYDTHHFLFDISLRQGETGTYLLRLQTTGQLQVPLWVGSQRSVYESLSREDLYMGLYMGIIAAMFLYNLFLLVSFRSRSYGLYVLNILMVGLTQVTFQGYSYRFLWPGLPDAAIQAPFITTSLAAITSTYFIMLVLRIHRVNPRLYMGMKVFIGAFMLIPALSLMGFKSLAYQTGQITSLLSAFYNLFVIFWVYRRGSRAAGFLLLAWVIFLVGICIFVLKDFGILPYNDLTANTMLIGSAAEMILLSFALADRINKLKKEKERSQQQMLEALQANEKFVQGENARLEMKVKERTRELEESSEELNTTLSHLKTTQGKLLHTEKMASLGQLTAGVAHEINNPINFVSASVKPLRRDVKYLWQLIAKQEDALKAMQTSAQAADIEAFKQKVDVDYLREEIESLLGGVEDGAARTAAIVRGLRNFSRLDDEELRPVSLEEGLDSTLLLLSHLLKDITLEKDYALTGAVECYPGKMNQVFMNILGNAVQAIQLSNRAGGEGLISITTRQSGQEAVICIRDNGIGMAEETKSRIFDPFFTTKQVGEGTGLGLSIVFGIVEAHKGRLRVKSEEGTGTQFILTVPLTYAGKPAILA